jgi:hypothetical protein
MSVKRTLHSFIAFSQFSMLHYIFRSTAPSPSWKYQRLRCDGLKAIRSSLLLRKGKNLKNLLISNALDQVPNKLLKRKSLPMLPVLQLLPDTILINPMSPFLFVFFSFFIASFFTARLIVFSSIAFYILFLLVFDDGCRTY